MVLLSVSFPKTTLSSRRGVPVASGFRFPILIAFRTCTPVVFSGSISRNMELIAFRSSACRAAGSVFLDSSKFQMIIL
uniref:Uncharacterized protein n=1 Tax=Trichobilharzia regenti TaxID=157069 RepID=A0AA85KBU0_TRIRE|nr:unnamed protein product [Trichobilharzia regenti]